jgi:hypothetical protein
LRLGYPAYFFLWSLTGGLTGIFYMTLKSFTRTFVTQMEYDFQKDRIIVHKLSATGKPRVIEVKPECFRMAEEEVAKDTLYFDSESGELFATVTRGDWYNEEVLFNLLRGNKVIAKEQV